MGLRGMIYIAQRPLVAAVLALCFAAQARAADRPANAVLHLADEGFIAGELRGSDDPTVLRWRSPFFTQPFTFPLSAVRAVRYKVSGPPPRQRGEYGFELAGDDVLFGDLLALTEDVAEVDSALVGRVHLPRAQIRRIYRRTADAIYLGPNGLAGWHDLSAKPHWRDEGGQPVTETASASLYGACSIPEKAAIEVELSWKQKPDFVLALGVNQTEGSVQDAFRLEVWDDELVAVGESARDADLSALQPIGSGAGSVRIQAFLDQKQRRLIVLARSGKPLADLTITSKKPAQVLPGVRLTNKKGDVRLEYLRITRWNGRSPSDVREDQSRVHRTNGSTVYGRLAAFDPKAKTFTVRDGKTETVVPHDAVADMFFPSATPASKASTVPADKPDRTLRVVYRDGSRFSGTVTRIEDAHLSLACPGVKEALRLPLVELRALIAMRPAKASTPPSAAGRPGRLEMDDVSLKGRLVGGTEQPRASCLVWHPDLGRNASPLLPGMSGRIAYRDLTPPKPAPPQPRAPQRAGFAQVITRIADGLASAPPPPSGRPSLHLRSGDTIPCTVTGIDEKGVAFKTPLSDATFVAHEKVKSIELGAGRGRSALDEAKRDRLLTLPRLQKDSPPTHLVCSKNGDFLRGRVQAMDDKRLSMEVRLETKLIPRDRVAQIIWLHPDELTGTKADLPPRNAAKVTRVQALRAGGNRLTFVAQRSDANSIAGTSDVLGACRVDLADVDQLLIGAYIDRSVAKLADHIWKLHPAVEPKFAQADAKGNADGRLTGTDSPLVGQPAPAFKLEMLDGRQFNLAEHKGQVVILDFWATWCGPCLRSLPLIEGVAREFADRKVTLVAVNMEEQADQIKMTLTRHKLKSLVALDRDGVVAARYAVTAIPQTVVIDRDGKVARLFVGGGQETADSLRKVLQELSGNKPSSPASP